MNTPTIEQIMSCCVEAGQRLGVSVKEPPAIELAEMAPYLQTLATVILERHSVGQKPIDMLLFCPMCHTQHIDAPEQGQLISGGPNAGRVRPGWTNPPHRSHLCHSCGCIWRPADVPTNGVGKITTKGVADNWNGKVVPLATLFGAPLVLKHLDHVAQGRTSAENVVDVLDAIVRAMRANY